jgi:simple sugar transport system ATP-binding protein
MSALLEVRQLTKRFGTLTALDHVDFDLLPGEVHALLGENGAGKSTFMNLLYGLLRPDSGSVSLEGVSYQPASPKDAVLAGVGMVHQHFMLIPALTVAENVALGDEPRRGFGIDLGSVEKKLAELAAEYHLEVNPRAKVADLSVGLRQRVEILKAFYRRARLLILDEPTALLTPQESQQLFRAVRAFQERGISVIFISHKLDEVQALSGRVTVLRRGQVVGTLTTDQTSPAELARLMVGRSLAPPVRPPSRPGPALLEVRDLQAQGLGPLGFQVRAGEILAVAGVEGNGQEALIAALAGWSRSQGEVLLDGRPLGRLGVRARAEAGLGLVPSDRQEDGLVLPLPVRDNLALRAYHRPPYSHSGVLDLPYWATHAETLVREFDVRPPDRRAPAAALSGGNQQKVVLARELAASPKVLVVSQPTRGLDIGASQFVYSKLLDLRAAGKAVLLVSLDLDEIFALADRIAVLYRGRLMGTVPSESATREGIGLMMLGQEA